MRSQDGDDAREIFATRVTLVNGEVAHFPGQTVALYFLFFYFIANLFTGNCLPRGSVKADGSYIRAYADVSSADEILGFSCGHLSITLTAKKSLALLSSFCARDKNASQD